jgi:hypothetical protein
MCAGFDKKIKPKNGPRNLRVSYTHIKLPTCTCFDHNCGHPQGDVYKGYVTKVLRNNAKLK